MQNLQALQQIDNSCLHYRVEFQGPREITHLAAWLAAGDEFDLFLSEQLERILQITGYSSGLIVKFGKEYQRVLYVELIKTYGLNSEDQKRITNLKWYAGEVDRYDLPVRLGLRVCWTDGYERPFEY